MQRIEVLRADITTLAVGAIVTSANEALQDGGRVGGAVHRAAGPDLLVACQAIPANALLVRCPTGAARLTPGFRLAAPHVIHGVSPVWRGGQAGEARWLASTYRHSLQVAKEQGVRSIAFPALGCGACGFPPSQAAGIAVRTLLVFLAEDEVLETVHLVAFNPVIQRALEAALKAPMR